MSFSQRMLRLLVFGVVVISVVAILTTWLSSPRVHPAVGKKLTGIQLFPLTSSGPSTEPLDLSNRTTLINFWGPWCPPCRLEFPHLSALKTRLAKESSLQVCLVSCAARVGDDLQQLHQDTQDFMTANGGAVEVFCDPRAASRLALSKVAELQGFAYPTTVLVGSDGTIRGLWQGYRPGLEVEISDAVRAELAASK